MRGDLASEKQAETKTNLSEAMPPACSSFLSAGTCGERGGGGELWKARLWKGMAGRGRAWQGVAGRGREGQWRSMEGHGRRWHLDEMRRAAAILHREYVRVAVARVVEAAALAEGDERAQPVGGGELEAHAQVALGLAHRVADELLLLLEVEHVHRDHLWGKWGG